jgi:hypothetical protein
MPGHLTHVMGDMEPATVDALLGLLAELDAADEEHGSVAVEDESGWSLSLSASGTLVWENVEETGGPRHLPAVDRAVALDHFRSVVEGDLATADALPWRPGYG